MQNKLGIFKFMAREKIIFLLLNSFIFINLIFGYLFFPGIGQDINNIISIFDNQEKLSIFYPEFVFNNYGFLLSILGIDVNVGIFLWQSLGLIFFAVSLQKFFPASYLFILLLIPNFYLSSFSTIQMLFLIPFWIRILTSESKVHRFLYLIVSVMFHWFSGILGVVFFLSFLPVRFLLGTLLLSLILLNEQIIFLVMQLLEPLIGGARYTNFVTDNFSLDVDVPMYVYLLLFAFLLFNPLRKAEQTIDKKKLIILKFSVLLSFLVFSFAYIGMPSSIYLRIANVLIIPFLLLLFHFTPLNQRRYVEVMLYLILLVNFVFSVMDN